MKKTAYFKRLGTCMMAAALVLGGCAAPSGRQTEGTAGAATTAEAWVTAAAAETTAAAWAAPAEETAAAAPGMTAPAAGAPAPGMAAPMAEAAAEKEYQAEDGAFGRTDTAGSRANGGSMARKYQDVYRPEPSSGEEYRYISENGYKNVM